MILSTNGQLDEIVFRPFLPWYLAKVGLLLLISAIFIGLALRFHILWALGIALTAPLLVGLAARYAAQKVIIRGNDLVLQTGLLGANEYIVPIWRAEIETPQNLLGRIFDYGTVRYRTHAPLELHNVASMRALRFLIAERRRHFLTALIERDVLVTSIEPPPARWRQGHPVLPATTLPSQPRL